MWLGLGGAWGPSGGHSTPSSAAPAGAGVSVSACPQSRVGLLRPWPGPGEMHYINVNLPPSWAPSFNKLSARHCQSNFSHFVSLFSVWGNPVSLGRGRLAGGKVQLCRDADRPTRQAHRTGAGKRGRGQADPGVATWAGGVLRGENDCSPAARFPGRWALGRWGGGEEGECSVWGPPSLT